MSGHYSKDDDWDDREWDETGKEDGYDEDDEEPTIPCPYCKQAIHEDAQRCPYCERYISNEDAPSASKPWWIILGTFVCLYIMVRWIVG